MADVTMVGGDGVDMLSGGTTSNEFTGGPGDDIIDASQGTNTINYSIGDGVDTVCFSVPRTYQYADYLTAATAALDELASFTGTDYSNSFFRRTDSTLFSSLPSDIGSVLTQLQDNGSVDADSARTALSELVDWINTPTSIVIDLGPGISPSDITIQMGSQTSFNTPLEFSISIKGQEGMLFEYQGFDGAANSSGVPLSLPLTFQFQGGGTVSLDALLPTNQVGAIGSQLGTEGNDTLIGSLASDTLSGFGGDDKLSGGAGSDSLDGGSGNDALDGGSGGDYLIGGDGDDVLAVGRDGGVASGGAGNDVYLFNAGQGVLSIDNQGAQGDIDTLSLGRINPADVSASLNPSSGALTLQIAATGDQITIPWFDPNSMTENSNQVISKIQFIDADGQARVFDLAAIVHDVFSDPSVEQLDVPLFADGAHELTGTEPLSGGDSAVRYALTGDLFAPLNLAPVASQLGQQNASEDSPFTLSLSNAAFADPEGKPLTFSATTADGAALPSWLQFDPATGTFTGTPTNGDVGSLSLHVTATDAGGLSTSQNFELVVNNTNDAPSVAESAVNQSATQDVDFSYVLPANTFADVDAGDVLTLSATQADGSALPSWLNFDAATGTFSGTPANADVGSLSVQVTAKDMAGETASTTFDIDIANVNDAPSVVNELTSQSARQGDMFSYVVPADTFTDIDVPDALALSARRLSATKADGSALPSWLNFDAATGTFSGTPANGDVGSVSIEVIATDIGGATASSTFDIDIANVNDAPVTVNALSAQSTRQGDMFSYVVPANTFADIDVGDALTLSATQADGSALPGWLNFDAASGTFSGTPANGDVGSLSLQVTAKDVAGATASSTFSLAIDNLNDPPTVANAIVDQNTRQGDAFSYLVPANTFADIDVGDSLTLSATQADGSALPSWLKFDAATRTFSGTPANGDVGSLDVLVTAKDLLGASTSTAFKIAVANVNDAPVIANPIAKQTATEDAPFSFAVPANTFSDIDAGDSLSLSATLANGSALPTWLKFDAATGTFSGTPANADVGTLDVRVNAVDLSGAGVSNTFQLAVANTNDAPSVATPIPDQTALTGALFQMAMPAGTFSDVDAGDVLSYSARLQNGDPLPAWLTFDASTRTLSGTAVSAGSWNIQITATDLSGASTSDVFALNVNQAGGSQNLIGGNGNDVLTGGSGNDLLDGRKGRDILSGGDGDDTLQFSVDGTWGKNIRTNAASGDKVDIKGKRASYDIYDGGAGNDKLLGTSGDDAILLEDAKSPAALSGARIRNIERIEAGAGNDVVDLTSKRYAYGDVTIDGGSGNDVLWSGAGNDVVLGGSGKDRLDGGAGNDYLNGGSGADAMNGGQGNDLLQGGSGDDSLKDTAGNGLMDGGTGNDKITSGTGNALLIGGKGSDSLVLGGGYDIIAFNRGDGRDTVSGKDSHATLSLGGGIRYQDLTLRRSGSSLILEDGAGDRITFEKWYDGKRYQSVSKLQIVSGAPHSGDPLANDKVESFDFKGVVAAFDGASHTHGVGKWALTNALAQFQLGGSNSAALGGELAYDYGVNGTLAGVAMSAAQEITSSAQFGKQAQTIKPAPVQDPAAVTLS
jgi:Ca2+-binding RTX toxin-like protein